METLIQAVKVCVQKYATFEGRATRAEFWFWTLFILIVNALLLCGLVLGISIANEKQFGIFGVSLLYPLFRNIVTIFGCNNPPIT